MIQVPDAQSAPTRTEPVSGIRTHEGAAIHSVALSNLLQKIYVEKTATPVLSLKVISNLRKTSILPRRSGTSSTWLQATLARNSTDPTRISIDSTRIGTDDRPTPKILSTSSLFVRLNLINFPTDRGIRVISAQASRLLKP